jgi:hypothetical protein
MTVSPGDKKLPQQPLLPEIDDPKTVKNIRWVWEEIARFLNSVSFATADLPDVLEVYAWAAGLDITSGVYMKKYNAGVTQAEFRAKFYALGDELPPFVDLRTADEGGSFSHDGSTSLIIEDIFADQEGAIYKWESADEGRWYYAWRLYDSTEGWSDWSDGNTTPKQVAHFIDVVDDGLADTGPPADWTVGVVEDVNNMFYCQADRPATNGKRIIGAIFQWKDASTGAWRDIDEDAGASVVHYDGSAIDHTYDPIACTITKASGNYGDAATYGGIIAIDVRASNFDNQYCNWYYATASQFSGATISGVKGVNLQFAAVGGVYTNVRIKVIAPLSQWDTEGYYAAKGLDAENYLWNSKNGGDLTSAVFRSIHFPIPSGKAIGDLEARVFFINNYSTSDDDTTGGEISSGGGGGGISGNNTTWTDFSDQTNWIFVRGHPDRCSYNFSGGELHIQGTQNNVAQDRFNIIGVRASGLFFPDANSGNLRVQCTFNNIVGPSDIQVGYSWALGLGLYTEHGAGNSDDLFFAGWGSRASNGNFEARQDRWETYLMQRVTVLQTFTNANNLNNNTLTIDLEARWHEANDYSWGPVYVEFSGGYNNNGMYNSTGVRTLGMQMQGARLFVGVIHHRGSNTGYCELTQVKLVEGLYIGPTSSLVINNPVPPSSQGPNGNQIFVIRS